MRGSPEFVFLQLDGCIWGDGRQWRLKCVAYVQSTRQSHFSCCYCKKPCFMKTGCWNGSRLFSAFVATSGYFTLTWIQKVFDIWSCLKHTFKATVNWDFMQIHPLLAWIKLIRLVYSQMGLRSFPFQFRSLLCLGSDVHTVLKAEIGVHTPVGRKKALAQSFSKSLLMFETCQKSQFTHHPHTYSLALNAAILSADLNTVVILSWSWQIFNISHK